MEIWEHILIISLPILFVIIVKLMRSAEKYEESKEIDLFNVKEQEQEKRQVIENHYHSHDNRTVNIYVKDENELKEIFSKNPNQRKLLK